MWSEGARSARRRELRRGWREEVKGVQEWDGGEGEERCARQRKTGEVDLHETLCLRVAAALHDDYSSDSPVFHAYAYASGSSILSPASISLSPPHSTTESSPSSYLPIPRLLNGSSHADDTFQPLLLTSSSSWNRHSHHPYSRKTPLSQSAQLAESPQLLALPSRCLYS